ncbi:MAG TPA: hypothetical protein VJL82_02780 [Rhizomicrobium sp.]|nr:hypothetical protein [Rhizomicrobium sp.]
MRNAAILALLAALAVPAFAAEEKAGGHGAAAEGGHGAKKEGEAKKGKPGTNVEMPYLMAPLTNAAGKLTGYAYISTRLTAMSEANALAVRDKLAFIQDTMVRDVNAASVTTPDDPEKVDIAATERRLLADATKVMGAGRVRLITICTVHVAELRPAQTPARDVPQEDMIPHGTTPKNPIKSRCED